MRRESAKRKKEKNMTKSEKTLEERITVADLLKACDEWYEEPETAKRIIHDAYMCAVSDYLTA